MTIKKHFAVFGFILASPIEPSFTASADIANSITMENGGVFPFQWCPVSCGDGMSFAIPVGGNTISESDVILNRGYDYVYTFEPMAYSRPWGTVPDLVNINGVWAIPENWSSLPEGIQPALQIVLKTNHKNLDTDKRYINVVHLPNGADVSDLPTEARRYLINVDDSDAGAYDGTVTSGWEKNDNGQWTYRRHDGVFVTNSWPTVDEKTYYLDGSGVMFTDTYAPDGTYLNLSGEHVSYKPEWVPDDKGWRYVQKNRYHAASTWLQDADEKWYYLNTGAHMAVDTATLDGYYVNVDGVWDGRPSTISNNVNPGPGMSSSGGWEQIDNNWKYLQEDGIHVTNAWKRVDGKWYYFDENFIMVANQETPDGHYVNVDGAWVQS